MAITSPRTSSDAAAGGVEHAVDDVVERDGLSRREHDVDGGEARPSVLAAAREDQRCGCGARFRGFAMRTSEANRVASAPKTMRDDRNHLRAVVARPLGERRVAGELNDQTPRQQRAHVARAEIAHDERPHSGRAASAQHVQRFDRRGGEAERGTCTSASRSLETCCSSTTVPSGAMSSMRRSPRDGMRDVDAHEEALDGARVV